MKISATAEISTLFKSLEIKSFNEALHYCKKLSYGRNSSREKLSAVITEAKGTCSSKHALLKQLAIENNFKNVQLLIGIYKMNQINTPKIGSVLSENGPSYIPEAHCYLRLDGNPVDVTSVTADFRRIEKDIIEEIEIKPNQVSEFKVAYHKRFLKNWLLENEILLSLKEIWNIREQCIANLSV